MPTAKLLDPSTISLNDHESQDIGGPDVNDTSPGTQQHDSDAHTPPIHPSTPIHSQGDNPEHNGMPHTDLPDLNELNCETIQALTKKPKGGTKKAKKPRAPHGTPKRPATSFMLFMSTNRSNINLSIAERGTAVNLRETSKAGSVLWRELSDTDREPYIARAAELHADWIILKAAHAAAIRDGDKDAENGYAPTTRKTRKGTTRDPNQPRRPGSPFVLFMNENRASIKTSLIDTGSATVADVGRLGGKLWSELPPEGRAVFTQRFHELNQAYRLAMTAYTDSVQDTIG